MHPGFLPPGEFALYFDTPGDDSVPVNQTVFIDGLGLDLDGQLDRFDFQGVMKEAVCHFGLALCIGVLQSGQRIERNVTLPYPSLSPSAFSPQPGYCPTGRMDRFAGQYRRKRLPERRRKAER